MRSINQLIIIFALLGFSNADAALNAFIDPLYWQATETLDWVHTNNLQTPHLVIGFKGMNYHYDPGVRFGIGSEGDIDTKWYFTTFHTRDSDRAKGNLTTGFLGGRISQTIPETIFYQSGQARYQIYYNIFDAQIGKHFDAYPHVMLRPIIGLKAGTIHQTVNTSFHGDILSITEHVKNDFKGIGPKAGLEANIVLWEHNALRFSVLADVEMAAMWGHWNITDHEKTSTQGSVTVYVNPRNFGALEMQGILGAAFDYKNLSASVSYEMNDWFNQCQIFDDETGTQNNDLVLQGLTVSFVYKFL